jgi:xanthine dehydrogenase accessory factor
MSELHQILDLWKHARTPDPAAPGKADDFCLAAVVAIEGSAYRRPGARMLLTASGLRAGTISGGCLEAEIAKKAWWLTEKGPSIQRYSSFFDDDGDMPYGLGCGGTVIVLLERGEPAVQALEALRRSVEDRQASVLVTNTGADFPGTALIVSAAGEILYVREPAAGLLDLAREALRTRKSSHVGAYFVEMMLPPPALTIFGAGDDAQPLVDFAATLGWYVTVADDRSSLAREVRFPRASRVCSLDEALARISPSEAAVLMSHSYEQDRKVLRSLLRAEMKYIGILGPRRRTERLVTELSAELRLPAGDLMARLHTPVGLDLGGHAPAAIALAIAAELQAVFAGREARKLSSLKPVHA